MKISRREFLTAGGLVASSLGAMTLLNSCTSGLYKKENGNKKLNADFYPIFDGNQYVKKDFSRLTKDTNLGLSTELIENHIGLYNKYIDKVNDAEQKMKRGELDEESLKNLAFSLNGMVLHDIYFSNLNSNSSKRSSAFDKAVEKTYGSVGNYMNNLVAIAEKVQGWSITALNLLNGELLNYGLSTHSDNFPSFVVPVLALDVYEHAFEIDFGKEGKSQYIEVFKKIVDWDLVSRRYELGKN